MEIGQKIMISKGYVFKNYLKGTVIEHKTKEKRWLMYYKAMIYTL